jgi:N-acetyl-anhydromuramyl-L-alanine amidase AmpD
VLFIEAANYSRASRGRGDIDVIVIHDEEFPEGSDSAERVAAFFHNQPKNRASGSSVKRSTVSSGGSSAHVCADSDSTVRCVRDRDIAWHAPPNSRSLGIEHDGFAKQTRAQWLDRKHGRKTLRNSAKVTAKWSAQYGIPVRKLSVAQLRAGARGFAGHVDVSQAFGMSSHHDPGPHFPWDWYLTRVRRYRWRYFIYTAYNSAGRVLARTGAVREGDGRITRAKQALREKAGAALDTIKRRRAL